MASTTDASTDCFGSGSSPPWVNSMVASSTCTVTPTPHLCAEKLPSAITTMRQSVGKLRQWMEDITLAGWMGDQREVWEVCELTKLVLIVNGETHAHTYLTKHLYCTHPRRASHAGCNQVTSEHVNSKWYIIKRCPRMSIPTQRNFILHTAFAASCNYCRQISIRRLSPHYPKQFNSIVEMATWLNVYNVRNVDRHHE
jgi:hypothetical protein